MTEPAPQLTPTEDPRAFLRALLQLALTHKASDLHLRARNHPILRLDGTLRAVRDVAPLTPDFLDQLARSLMSERQRVIFDQDHQVDLSVGFKDIGRVRAHIFRQRGVVNLVLRLIQSRIPTLAELKLPDLLKGLVKLERGLVVVTGATGSGKSTTLAALVEELNQNQAKHVLTIEDPVEFLFTERRALITQREIGLDTNSFAEGLKAALRADPDVILLGEMRDAETIEVALGAAETGHLVLATAHAPAAAETISRLLTVFPAEVQISIRAKLAQNLRAVVSQRLLPHPSGSGRVVACEVLTISARARELILDPLKLKDLTDLIKKGSQDEGMLAFDQSLFDLVRKKEIDAATALQYASSPTDLKLRLEGF